MAIGKLKKFEIIHSKSVGQVSSFLIAALNEVSAAANAEVLVGQLGAIDPVLDRCFRGRVRGRCRP